jgi:Ras-related GTP-binding protein C/D
LVTHKKNKSAVKGVFMKNLLVVDTQRDVQQRMGDALADAQLEYIHLTYYLTSIYDNSIYEAFSKIIQKLIRELPTLENLLNVLCSVKLWYH